MVNCGVLCRPTGFLKIIEIALSIVCLALVRHYDLGFGGSGLDTGTYRDRYLLGVSALGGMILITLPLLIAYVFGEASIEKTILETLYNIIGLGMNLTAGALAVDFYKDISGGETRDAGLGMGALCLINALIYFIDAFFAFRNRRG